MPTDHTNSRFTIVSWDGNLINDGTNYKSRFSLTPDGPNNYKANAVMTRRVGRFPSFVRQQPLEKVIQLSIDILVDTLDSVNQLRLWFDAAYGPKYLVVKDTDNTEWRIRGLPEVMAAGNARGMNWKVSIRCDSGTWESNTEESDTTAVTSSGTGPTLENLGNAITYPTFTVSPQSALSSSNGYTKRRRINLVNRSDAALSDAIGDGYPIDLANDSLDTDALNTASKLQSDLGDLRVWLAGAQIDRWPDPSTDDSTTKVWANLQMRGRKTITVASAMTGSSPADGGVLTVNNAEGTAGWPERGGLRIDNETLLYDGKGSDGYSFLNIKRGARNTTAASHSASTTGYWIEHLFLDFIYGYSAVANPSPPDDKKPLIDLSLSTNGKHVWSLPTFIGTRASRQWIRTFTEDNPISQYIAASQGGTFTFEDRIPDASHPQFNNLEIACPVPISTASNSIEMDRTIPLGLAMRIYIQDQIGTETLLNAAICQTQLPAAEANKQFSTNNALGYRIRINAKHSAVVGVREDSGARLSSSSVSADGWIEAQVLKVDKQFRCDALAAQISGLVAGEIIEVRLHTDGDIEDESINVPAPSAVHYQETTRGAGISSQAYLVFPLDYGPIWVPTGNILAGVGYDTAGADTFTFYWTRYRNYAEGRRRFKQATGSAWFYDGNRSGCILLLSAKDEPQDDAPRESGDSMSISNLELTYYSTYTPSVFISAEESIMLVQGRLANVTTGDYIDIEFPMTLGQVLTIDCENKRVIDEETGWDVPFTVAPSNPAEWISLIPGENEITFTQDGLVDVDVGHSFRHRRL